MFYVATLISAPDRAAVTDALARAAARYLPHGRPVDWLKPGVAVDIAFLIEDAEPGEVPALLKDMAGDLRDIIGGNAVDVVIQPQDNRRKKLLVADMDSTMIGQECIDELADYAGVKSQVAEITERAMRGDIAFAPALRERVALLKGLPAAIIDTVLVERIRLTPGGPTLVATMRANGAYTCVVSGGFTAFTAKLAAAIGFDEQRANALLVDAEGRLTGEVAEPVLGREAKLETLRELTARLRLDPVDTLAVGDGANDLPMIEAAGLGVAFHGKPVLREAAAARIDHGDLTALLYAQGYRREEFVERSNGRVRLLQAERDEARLAVGVGHQQHRDLLALALRSSTRFCRSAGVPTPWYCTSTMTSPAARCLSGASLRRARIDSGDDDALDVIADPEFLADVIGQARQFEPQRLLHDRFLRRHRVLLGLDLRHLFLFLEPADRDLEGLFLALADDDDVDLLADRRVGDDTRQVAHLLDVVTVELHDDVARLDAGGLCGPLVVNAGDKRAVRRPRSRLSARLSVTC